MAKDDIRAWYDPASRMYTIHCPAMLDKGPTDYQVSEYDIMMWSNEGIRVDNWDLIQFCLDKHLLSLPIRRREAIEHTRRLNGP